MRLKLNHTAKMGNKPKMNPNDRIAMIRAQAEIALSAIRECDPENASSRVNNQRQAQLAVETILALAETPDPA